MSVKPSPAAEASATASVELSNLLKIDYGQLTLVLSQILKRLDKNERDIDQTKSDLHKRVTDVEKAEYRAADVRWVNSFILCASTDIPNPLPAFVDIILIRTIALTSQNCHLIPLLCWRVCVNTHRSTYLSMALVSIDDRIASRSLYLRCPISELQRFRGLRHQG
jgi:hypothetical protein